MQRPCGFLCRDPKHIKSDGPLVEAPSLIHSNDGVYSLFFSSGCTRVPSHDLKYVTSKDAGPSKRTSKPLLVTGDWNLLAPGSVLVRRESQRWRMVFHSRITTPFRGVRTMHTAALVLSGTNVSFDT
ncbi:uncharacterized protein BDZ99DRAFT_541610 [Mytilinidion resinicola]|uniref:Uncharacterized protein n=1 Tax=Mytilinidion resinicola TaxID=574789 RepID=A0A6A6Z650_9PEZI|nr:uncharacterized protein BDZ99DRAFT_541610 [Mytilinidion resinicola]KAF2815764.1 hypothetical protein BDZ99DRAFT_541610 [Mytilinidion resinicola]